MRVESDGCGLSMPMVSGNEFDTPPPGAGLNTVTAAMPAVPRSVDGICASNCELLTYVVGRSWPFHRTFDPVTNPVPATDRVNWAPPTGANAGVIWLRVGAGFAPVIV